MLKKRIISTLHFFDLQDYPLTLLELHRFLLADLDSLNLDHQGEIGTFDLELQEKISVDQILACLENECRVEVKNLQGFYFLAGRQEIISLRLKNYYYGIQREKLIKKYIRGLRHLPFVTGVALAGSQAMGQEKESSDIDLLIITNPRFMWLARTLVTAYFQILGKRRHGLKIQNRFCLNHYLAGPKKITQFRNFYTAHEYLKLRSLVYGQGINSFQKNNSWINYFFPNAEFMEPDPGSQTKLQQTLEKLLSGSFGKWLEQKLQNWQLPKIRQEKFILVSQDELSFHPDSKQQALLLQFIKS
jgi:predicted nucleotidyltransferase